MSDKVYARCPRCKKDVNGLGISSIGNGFFDKLTGKIWGSYNFNHSRYNEICDECILKL